MEVEALLQSVANQMTVYETDSIADKDSSNAPRTVTTGTQSQTWNELTLQMVSDIVSHQIVQMKQDSTSDALQSSCEHLKGMVWKDIADMIVHSHNVLCAKTSAKLVNNVVRVTIDWPQSGLHYVKPSVEVHIFPQNKNLEAEHCLKNQKESSNGVNKITNDRTEEDTLANEADSMPSKQTICKDSPGAEISRTTAADADSMHSKLTICDSSGAEMSFTSAAEADSMHSKQTICDLPGAEISQTTAAEADSMHSKQTICDLPGAEISQTTAAEADSMHSKQTICDSLGAEISTANVGDSSQPNADSDSFLFSMADAGSCQQQDSGIEKVNVDEESKESCKDFVKEDNRTNLLKETSVEIETSAKGEQPQTTSKRNSHVCEHCGKVCRTAFLLKRHSQTHVSQEKIKKEPGFKCEVCEKVFQSRWKLSKHEPVHAPNHHVHPCPHCDKVCRTVQSLQRHQRIHVVAPSHCCEDCGATFRVQVKLKQHKIKEHNVVEKHVCNICGAVYKNETTLKDHIVEHSGKEFLCDICGKKFRRPELLRCHRFRHGIKNRPKSFRCPMCPKAYAAESPLQIHIRLTHMKEREHVCRVCGKKFFYRYQMVAHEQAHKGIMQHVCKYCNLGFLKRASLVAHEMVHTGNKPFKCTHCAKGFATKAHRARHEKIHTDTTKPERAFQCKICSATFRYKGQCVEHEKRHAGVKDHPCDFCGKAFVSRGDLIRHLRTHTAGKPHKCKHCDLAFTKRKELLMHEGSHGVKHETIQKM